MEHDRHVRDAHGGPNAEQQCTECSYSTRAKYNFRKHMETHHNILVTGVSLFSDDGHIGGGGGGDGDMADFIDDNEKGDNGEEEEEGASDDEDYEYDDGEDEDYRVGGGGGGTGGGGRRRGKGRRRKRVLTDGKGGGPRRKVFRCVTDASTKQKKKDCYGKSCVVCLFYLFQAGRSDGLSALQLPDDEQGPAARAPPRGPRGSKLSPQVQALRVS